MALSPWPTSPVALATATAALRAATGIRDDVTAQRLGAAAAARVEALRADGAAGAARRGRCPFRRLPEDATEPYPHAYRGARSSLDYAAQPDTSARS